MGLGRVWIGAHRFWSLVKLAHPRPDAFRYFEKPGAMPLPSFAPNEKADLLRDTDPDLVFLMASHRVPEELQLAIFATHDTMALFSKLDRDEEGIRAFLATEWDLRPSNGVASRRTISLLLTAWEAAREQVAKENQARAEARISGKPIDIIAHDFELMKKACGKEHVKKASSQNHKSHAESWCRIKCALLRTMTRKPMNCRSASPTTSPHTKNCLRWKSARILVSQLPKLRRSREKSQGMLRSCAQPTS